MNTKKFILIIVALIISLQPVFTQKAPIKFGKVDISDLEMKYYEPDSSAPAVILCDYGYFNSTQFQFTRILRIKILKKEGYNWANRGFNTSSKTSIRGITFNLENGEIIKNKLKPESIFKERVTEDFYIMRVAMPNVKVGSVIDIQFVHPGIPYEWRFQEKIPVKYNELIMEDSPYVNFRKNFFGYEPLSVTSDRRWVAKNMPAFKEEPYITTVENYISKFEFDILNISFPGYFKDFTTNWEAVNDLLLDAEYFGDAIIGSLYLYSIAKEIKEKYKTDEEKLIAAYETVKKVKWNEKERLFTSSPTLGYVYKEEIGNSADVNLILLQLLKKLDFEVYPIALSTRENGILNPFFPSYHKLNYVIVYLKANNKEYLLDATEEYMPVGLIPKRCINSQGRLIDEEKTKWVDLKT
ncbi:MAG: hypothetical protein JXB17_02280, partial [Bacteroidales bacterium]|nr:hypothetical protein [Bacteroidales bacterium]